MRLHKFLLTATVAAVFTMSAMPSSADIVTFDFRDDEDDAGNPTAASMLVAAFDGGAAGSTVTVDGLTVTAVEIIGQDGSSNLTDPAAAHTLNIAGNQDALSVNHQGPNGTIGGGGDSSHFNPGEGVVFTFDQDVTLTNVEVESFTAGQEFNLTTGGSVFALADANNPFSVDIAAGDTFRFDFVSLGTTTDTQIRIESFTVETAVIPEPSSLALLGLFGSVAMIRRRR